eukprot:gnl/TRDRNA2_/TRDRNA2_72825_c0_seq1.p1 gnl/TRDRNA2_/TRDRNA2_72825_c0~~gnl/TRDRNA2_/TRDRNA2_72825_c0_seq1.p1  ORF type:complete len:115 (-),score=31.91 gnl/TRDRNA2_/TRDRNA2_72825_c0_seq1:17-361(-)
MQEMQDLAAELKFQAAELCEMHMKEMQDLTLGHKAHADTIKHELEAWAAELCEKRLQEMQDLTLGHKAHADTIKHELEAWAAELCEKRLQEIRLDFGTQGSCRYHQARAGSLGC